MERSDRASRLLRRGLIALCLGITLALAGSFLALLHSPLGAHQTDFLVYAAVAKLVVQGHGGEVYQFPQVVQAAAQLLHHVAIPRQQAVFLYPPFMALVLAPFGALPYTLAYSLWAALNVLLLGIGLRSLQRFLGLRGELALLWWLAAISFLPVLAAVAQGQVTMLLLALLAGTLVTLDRQPAVSGVFLALAVIKPPLVLPVLLVLLLRRRWEVLRSFALTAAALFLLPLPWLGPAIDLQYLHALLAVTRWSGGGFGPGQNENLFGLTHRVLPALPATLAQYGLDAAVLLLLIRLARRWPRNDRPLAAAVGAALLLSPHVLFYDLSLLLVPAAVAFRHHRTGFPLPAMLIFGYVAAVAGVASSVQWPVLGALALTLWLSLVPEQLPATHHLLRVLTARNGGIGRQQVTLPE